VSNQRVALGESLTPDRFRELRMVESWHGSVGEWTYEGEQKGETVSEPSM